MENENINFDESEKDSEKSAEDSFEPFYTNQILKRSVLIWITNNNNLMKRGTWGRKELWTHVLTYNYGTRRYI